MDNQDLLFDGVVGCLAHFWHTFALLQNSLEIESPAIACGAWLLLASQTGFEPVTYGLEVLRGMLCISWRSHVMLDMLVLFLKRAWS